MDIRIYQALIEAHKFQEAHLYNTIHMPLALYKYVPLFDEGDRSDYHEENRKRVTTLRNNQLWLSTSKQLNDPFELKGVFLDGSVIDVEADLMNSFQMIVNSYCQRKLIGSLSASTSNNMPLWAHYSNNHKGICVKYEVIKIPPPFNIYPVIYQDNRKAITNLDMAKDYIALVKYKETKNFDDVVSFMHRFDHYALLKHSFWAYEKEYRVVVNNSGSQSVDLAQIHLKIDSIFVGINCSAENREYLLDLAGKLKATYRELSFDEGSSTYSMKET